MPSVVPVTPPRVPLVDMSNGQITRAWFLFLLSLYNRTNSGQISNEYLAYASPALTDEAAIIDTAVQNAVLAAMTPEDYALYYSLVNDLQSAPPSINADQVKIFSDAIQGLALAPANTPQLHRKAYGSFYDTTSQTAAAINTAYAITYNSTTYSAGVYVGTPTSRIYVDRPGIYNIQFSAQLDKTSAAAGNVWIWLDKNGTAVANSATQVTLQGSSAAAVAAWNFLQEMNAGDYFRLMWATDDTACYIKNDLSPFTPVPDIPSMILTVTNNINDNTPY